MPHIAAKPYCECGCNSEHRNGNAHLATPEEYEKTHENALKELVGTPKDPDSITFSGNGEPTLHSDFLEVIDNTTEEEINLWLGHQKKIKPRKTMIYVIDRETPEKDFEKLCAEEMKKIAEKVENIGKKADFYA